MKGEKKELEITEVTFDQFQKLNLIGYRRIRKYYRKDNDQEVNYNDTYEILPDSQGDTHIVQLKGFYSKVIWEKVLLADIVRENIEFSKKEGWTHPICISIYDPITTEDIADAKERYPSIKLEEDIFSMCLYEKSYLDKYLTRSGPQTYLIRCNVRHLYSRRNYFYTKDDYFEVPKYCTRAVYLIKFN